MLFEFSRPAAILYPKEGIVWLRFLASIPWLDSAFVGPDAKCSPAFLHGSALATRIDSTFVHTAIDSRVTHLLTAYVVPHVAIFALLIAIADVMVGISLALGLFVRVGSLIAIARALTNIIVASGAGVDTIGYNGLLIGISAICLATAAGRKAGLDARLINRFPRNEALRLIA